MYFKGLKFLTFSTLILCSVAVASEQTTGDVSGQAIAEHGSEIVSTPTKSTAYPATPAASNIKNITHLYQTLVQNPGITDSIWSVNSFLWLYSAGGWAFSKRKTMEEWYDVFAADPNLRNVFTALGGKIEPDGRIVPANKEEKEAIGKRIYAAYSALQECSGIRVALDQLSSIVLALRNIGISSDNTVLIELAKAIALRYYDGQSVVQGIKECLSGARVGPLAQQIGKFVGRVNTGDNEDLDGNGGSDVSTTGSGTLIEWAGMPESLRGRVVLTCGHMRADRAGQNRTILDGSVTAKVSEPLPRLVKTVRNVLIDRQGHYITRLISMTENSVPIPTYNNDEHLSFMIDLSDDGQDIQTYVKGNNKTLSDPKHQAIPVAAAYTLDVGSDDDLNNKAKIPDIQILILKEPARDCTQPRGQDGKFPILAGYNLDKSLSVRRLSGPSLIARLYEPRIVDFMIGINSTKGAKGKGLHLFNIGYGRPGGDTVQEKFITGWNTKKRCITNFVDGIGPSDSGSPMMFQTGGEYLIVGIVTHDRGMFLPLLRYIPWIKGVANDYAASNEPRATRGVSLVDNIVIDTNVANHHAAPAASHFSDTGED